MQATNGTTDFAGPTEARRAFLQNSEVVQDYELPRVVPPQSQIKSDGLEAAMKPDETQTLQADAGAQQQRAGTPPTHDVSGAAVACSDSFPMELETNDTIDGRDSPIGDKSAVLLLGMTQEGTNFDYMSQVGTQGSISPFTEP